jgi:hypothetical protein
MDNPSDTVLATLECGTQSPNLLGKYTLTLIVNESLQKCIRIPIVATEVTIEFSLQSDNFICEFKDRYMYEIYVSSSEFVLDINGYYGATITIKKINNEIMLADFSDCILTLLCDEWHECEIKQINKISGTKRCAENDINTDSKISKFVDEFDQLIGRKRRTTVNYDVECKFARTEN